MAISKSISILTTLTITTDAILEAETMANTFVALRGDGCEGPDWPFAVHAMIERIRVAAEDLECLLRQQVVPLIQDFERTISPQQGEGVQRTHHLTPEQ
jgi:hypothetical protein